MNTFRNLKFIGITVVLIAPVISSCKKGNHDHPTPPPPVKVRVMELASSNSSSINEYSGTVSSVESTTLSFAVPGTITSLNIKEGQKVAKGSLLGSLRADEYQNSYNIAQAELAEAQDGYDRLKKLHDANALPDIKWVEIQQKLKQAQNAAEIARRTLDDTKLYSPLSGTVSQKFADVGQTVIPAQPIVEIITTNDITIDIPVSENEIAKFTVGDKASVTLDALGKDTLDGKVSQKSVMADPLTRSYTVKVAIPNPDNKILPGMIGNVYFSDLKSDETVSPESGKDYILPSQVVLLNHDNRWFVWVMEDCVAKRRFVTVDELTANGVKVTSGLKPGDKVIVEGMQKVGTGTRLVTVN